MTDKPTNTLSFVRVFIAIAIGLGFCSIIWLCQPGNQLLLKNSPIAGSYLPVLGIAQVIILAVIINPLLRWKLPAFALSVQQLAIVFGMVLVAGSATAAISMWPHALAAGNMDIAKEPVLAEIHQEMDLPESLYLDPIEYGAETPNSLHLNEELPEGEKIPWSAWLPPTMSWGSMLASCILLMVGLALVVYPQWRENERLPFPLLKAYQALIETPEDGGRFPLIFRNKLFWGAAGTVFVIYMFKGLNHHTGGAVPGFPTGWGLYDILDHGITRYLNYWIKQNLIVFTIVGIAYFVPNRVSFSIWATVLGYQAYRLIGYQFFAPFHGSAAVNDHRNGAVLGVAVIIIWLGRRHWLAVAKAMFRPAKDDVDRRNRAAGLMFLFGCIGLLGWQLWAGNSLIYALLAVVIVILTTLVLARIVAETGLPLCGNSLLVGNILDLFPIAWLNNKAIFLTRAVDLVISEGASRVSPAVTAMHGIGIHRKPKPKRQIRLAQGFFILIVVGLLVAGAVHVWMGYNFPGALDGKGGALGNSKELNLMLHNPVRAFARGSWGNAPYSRLGHTIFGFLMGSGLQIACLFSPLWPLHPAGLLIMETEFIRWAWVSILLGWALKRAIVVYGGAKAYRLAKPLFLGLILGEVFSAILWAAVPAILIWLGADAAQVGRTRVGLG